MIWTIAGDIIGGVGLIIMIFLYFKQTKDGEKDLKIQKEEYEEQLKKRAETLQEGQKNFLQEIEAIKQAVFAWRTSDQPISQEQVKSFSGKVDAVAATAAALWLALLMLLSLAKRLLETWCIHMNSFRTERIQNSHAGSGGILSFKRS